MAYITTQKKGLGFISNDNCINFYTIKKPIYVNNIFILIKIAYYEFIYNFLYGSFQDF